jgi:Family of unknown function (DUF6283)
VSTVRVSEASSDQPLEYRDRPCRRCPWRTDTDLGDFSDDDFEKLRRANGTVGAEAPLGAPQTGCHLDQPGTAHAYRLCAGWLAVVGRDHLTIRLSVAIGALPAEVLDPKPGWPELVADLDEILQRRAQFALPDRGGAPSPAAADASGSRDQVTIVDEAARA